MQSNCLVGQASACLVLPSSGAATIETGQAEACPTGGLWISALSFMQVIENKQVKTTSAFC
jgi:hypothetical protein